MNNDHIELVFNGLYDRISGNETYASRYLGGVLWANEPSNTFVSGNEGFADTVSDGVKKAWEYIKGMFKKIFDWVFGGSSKKKVEAVKTEVKEAQETIKEVQSPPEMTLAQANAMVEKISSKTGQQAAQRKEELRNILKRNGVNVVPAASVKEVAKKVFEFNAEQSSSFDKQSKKLESLHAGFLDQLEKIKKVESPAITPEGYGETISRKISALVQGSQPVLNGMVQAKKEVAGIKDLNSASTFLSHSSSFINAISNNLENIKSSKSDLEKKIHKLEEEMNKGNDLDKQLDKPFIDGLKNILKLCSSIISNTNEFMDTISSIAKTIKGCSPL